MSSIINESPNETLFAIMKLRQFFNGAKKVFLEVNADNKRQGVTIVDSKHLRFITLPVMFESVKMGVT